MSTHAPAGGMGKYMTNSFSVKSINKPSEGVSKKNPTSKSPIRGPTRKNRETKSASNNSNKVMIIVTAVSTVVAIVSLAILFAIVFNTKNTKDTNAEVEKIDEVALKQESCQGDRRLLYELGDLCHDARSSNGPVLKCDVVGNNALLQGVATIGNSLEYGYDWEILTVFRPCDPESDEPNVALSIMRSGKLTTVQADEQSLSGVNKTYDFDFENRHYGVAGDTMKTLQAIVNASFFSTTQNGITEMRLLVVLQQTCWPGATSEQCNPSPITVKNQVGL